MYIIFKHYKSIDSYHIDRILFDKAQAIVYCDICNKSETSDSIEYIICEKMNLD